MIIKIWATDQGDGDEGGWMYDIFLSEDIYEDTESDDGGLCTGSKVDALEMATAQAIELLKRGCKHSSRHSMKHSKRMCDQCGNIPKPKSK